MLAIIVLSFAASTARADVCQPSGATLVRSNSKATVYKVHSGAQRIFYGCLRSSGLQTRLAAVQPPQSSAGKFRLRGHFVAFVYTTLNIRIKAFNLLNGAHIKRDPGAGEIQDLVVSRNGRLAWTAYYHFMTLYWSSFSSRPHDLKDDFCTSYDPGSDCIKPGSLRLTGHHHDREIAWIEGTATKRFVIP